MHSENFRAGLIGCVAGLVMTNACWAAGESIEIVKAEGTLAATTQSGKKVKAVGSNSVLQPGSALATGPNGRAVVRVGNTGVIVLEKNSKVEIGNKDHAGFLRQVTGMIYYAINSVKGDKKVEVRTPVATIGIRGTRFMVADTPERKEIDMRKGEVNVASQDGDFEVHKKAEADEFEAFKQEGRDAIAKEQKEFEKYQANAQREFVEFKREFSLGANRMVSFDGKVVHDQPLNAESTKDMESFEAYAAEWIKEIHD